MPGIAVLNDSSEPDANVAFAVQAVDDQMREDFCPRWPGIDYQPITFFRTAKDLPTSSGLSLLCTIRDKHDDPRTAAYHSWAGVPFIRIGRNLGVLSVLLSHEIPEEMVNPTCMQTFGLPNGRRAAKEVVDPVQAWIYERQVTILGETRRISVSAFVLPTYFSQLDDDGPTYFCPGRTDVLAQGGIADGGYLPYLTAEAMWDRILGAGTDLSAVKFKTANDTSRAVRRKAAWELPG